MICGSFGNRVKESLVVDFINQINLDEINDKVSIIDVFFKFVQVEQKCEVDVIIVFEKFNIDVVKCYIVLLFKCEYVLENGIVFNEVLFKFSLLNLQY